MRDLAELLSRPGAEVSCLDLAGAAVDDRDTVEVIDAEARRRYEDRHRELQSDIDEAEAAQFGQHRHVLQLDRSDRFGGRFELTVRSRAGRRGDH